MPDPTFDLPGSTTAGGEGVHDVVLGDEGRGYTAWRTHARRWLMRARRSLNRIFRCMVETRSKVDVCRLVVYSTAKVTCCEV